MDSIENICSQIRQLINKVVRKNCIDVERVIIECLSEPKREMIIDKSEPIQSKKLKKELSRYISKYNAKYNQELITLDIVKQTLIFRNYGVY